MNAIATHALPSHLLAELALHLRNSGSGFTVTQAATEAIRAWIAVNPPQQPAVDDSAPSQGYQWKTLFLPSGTELRMSTRESTYFARVVGDDILFEGRRVSPRGMTIAIAGNGRNAWRDLWLKLPAERYWKQAIRCRHEHERKACVPGDSPVLHPAENIAAAAVTMSDALKTMLALMERANAHAVPDEDRRIHPARRKDDNFAADCAFD
jgi:hypothetical protein